MSHLRIASVAILLATAFSHGLLSDPPQRGLLSGSELSPSIYFHSAPRDRYAHFPTGLKSTVRGAGSRSQEVAGAHNWTLFDPMAQSDTWRSGVCGDEKGGPQQHLRGGRFYYRGRISRKYTKGQVIEVSTVVIANHGGFMQLHLCDVSKCNGEISKQCFKRGTCHELKRAKSVCDYGAERCGPIDEKHPGRWYLPCKIGNGLERFGGATMRYRLQKGVKSRHCVLHWYWASAHQCSAPGLSEYFERMEGAWGKCRGPYRYWYLKKTMWWGGVSAGVSSVL